MSEGDSLNSLWDKSKFPTETDVKRVLRECGASDTQIAETLTDPFITNHVQYVHFDSYRPAEEITLYYTRVLSALGWRKTRGLLIAEYCNCEGNWGGVYEKDDKRFFIRVDGLWKRQPYEKDYPLGYQRTIGFLFLRMEPSEILGDNYQRKKQGI